MNSACRVTGPCDVLGDALLEQAPSARAPIAPTIAIRRTPLAPLVTIRFMILHLRVGPTTGLPSASRCRLSSAAPFIGSLRGDAGSMGARSISSTLAPGQTRG